MSNIISVVDTRLARSERNNKFFGLTYVGPCPWCAGTDRFHVYPDAGEDIPGVGNLGRFHCMGSSQGRAGCDRKGDMIGYVQQFHNLTWRAACERLGIDAQKIIDYRREQGGQERTSYVPGREIELPFADLSTQWRETGSWLAYKAAEALRDPRAQEAKDYLLSRGLTEAKIEQAGLGYYPRYKKVRGTEWGFKHGVLKIPRGIVIPWQDGQGQVICLRFRRLPGDESDEAKDFYGVDPNGEIVRYKAIFGSSPRWLYGWRDLAADCDVALFEGEIDSLVASQQSTSICVATGSTSWGRSPRMMRLLAACNEVLVAFDANTAGDKAAHYWLDALDNARRWRPLWQDANDMARDGADLGEWVATGLEEAPQTVVEPVEPSTTQDLTAESLKAAFQRLRSLADELHLTGLKWRPDDKDELPIAAYLNRMLKDCKSRDQVRMQAAYDAMLAQIEKLSALAPAPAPGDEQEFMKFINLPDDTDGDETPPDDTPPPPPTKESLLSFAQRLARELPGEWTITGPYPASEAEAMKQQALAELRTAYSQPRKPQEEDERARKRRARKEAARRLEEAAQQQRDAEHQALLAELANKPRTYPAPFADFELRDVDGVKTLVQVGMFGCNGERWTMDEWAAMNPTAMN